MKTRKCVNVLGLAVAALLASLPAKAQIDCSVDVNTDVDFGIYDVFNVSPTDSIGTIEYECQDVGASTITIDLSRGNAPTYNPRWMLQGAEPLNYNLYLDAARTTIWGDGTGGTSRYGPVTPPESTVVELTIYGRIPPEQDVSGGNYEDTITVTINF